MPPQENHVLSPDPQENTGLNVRFTPLGLALFSAALILASGLITARLLQSHPAIPRESPTPQATAMPATKPGSSVPAWGELITHDINLTLPDEYLGFTLDAADAEPQWTFTGMTRDEVRNVMQACGLPTELTTRAISDTLSHTKDGNTIVHPDPFLLTSLSPPVRAKLYGALAKMPGNPYMTCPYCFPQNTFEQWFGNGTKDTRELALVRSLLYPRGDGLCFSDFEYLMSQTPDAKSRMDILRSLGRLSTVLVRVRIRPDTDIERLLAYWNRGTQPQNLKPLIESVSRLPDGGTVSLLYFLPKLARDRLNTFPMPPLPGDPVMDCHWTSMNFFNERPDNKFTGTTNTIPYLKTNYDEVPAPGRYGDVILICNSAGKPIHSAVYLADNIIFTKNGFNYVQPWILMRLKDLLALYTTDAPPKMCVYRSKK